MGPPGIIDVPVWPTRLLVPLFLLVLLAGCTTSAVIILAAWGTATDERSIVAQVDDLLITTRIRAGLLMADVGALAALDVFCHRGMVVLAGVVPPGSDLGRRGVEIAQAAGGVRQVDTYFVPSRESLLRDAAAGAEILSLIVGDLDLRAAQVDIGVVDGHAVVAGVVESAAKVDRIVALDDLWGHCAVDLTCELSAKREEQRVDALERALLRRLGRAPARSTSVDTAGLASWVTAERGRVSVARMADAAGVSRQTLARAFRETVGVTPKVYCMLARFQAALAYAGRGASVEWAGVASDLGYADQSHMIMEFRRFSSLTPHEVASGAWFHPFIERARRARCASEARSPGIS